MRAAVRARLTRLFKPHSLSFIRKKVYRSSYSRRRAVPYEGLQLGGQVPAKTTTERTNGRTALDRDPRSLNKAFSIVEPTYLYIRRTAAISGSLYETKTAHSYGR